MDDECENSLAMTEQVQIENKKPAIWTASVTNIS